MSVHRWRNFATTAALALALAAAESSGAASPSDKPPEPVSPAALRGAPASYKDWSGVWEASRATPFWGFPAPSRPPDAPPPPNLGAACIPMGMPGMMMMLYLMETIARPDQLTIASEDQSILRRIYLDGRGHPKDMWPTYAGHSIGHWEGDVLVVDTVGIRTDTVFNNRQHSDALHIVEHMRMVEPNTFEDVILADDPKDFDKPWTTTQRYARQPKGTEINEFVCEENNRNRPDDKGQPTFVPPR